MPQLQWKIDLGHVLTIVVMLVAMVASHARVTAELSFLRAELERMRGFGERLARVEAQMENPRPRLNNP